MNERKICFVLLFLLFFNGLYRVISGFLSIFQFIIFLFLELLIFSILLGIKPKVKFLLKFSNPNLLFWLFILIMFTLWCQINLAYILRVIGFQVGDDLMGKAFVVITLLLIIFVYFTFNRKRNI